MVLIALILANIVKMNNVTDLVPALSTASSLHCVQKVKFGVSKDCNLYWKLAEIFYSISKYLNIYKANHNCGANDVKEIKGVVFLQRLGNEKLFKALEFIDDESAL